MSLRYFIEQALPIQRSKQFSDHISRKTVRFSEQIMLKDKYPSISRPYFTVWPAKIKAVFVPKMFCYLSPSVLYFYSK